MPTSAGPPVGFGTVAVTMLVPPIAPLAVNRPLATSTRPMETLSSSQTGPASGSSEPSLYSPTTSKSWVGRAPSAETSSTLAGSTRTPVSVTGRPVSILPPPSSPPSPASGRASQTASTQTWSASQSAFEVHVSPPVGPPQSQPAAASVKSGERMKRVRMRAILAAQSPIGEGGGL